MNKEIVYEQEGKFAIFDGIRFCRDDDTGYYLNSTFRIRLHRYVYEAYFGTIPKGFEVHHIDHDKNNNAVENLTLLTASDHRQLHGDELSEEQREALRSNMLTKAIPAAKAWHKSQNGREWHRRHYIKHKDSMHHRIQLKCQYCGKICLSEDHGSNRFCSNACRSAQRRKDGKDDVIRVCAWCGREFKTNRYSSAKCCSRSCSNYYRHKNKKDQEETC